MSFVIVFLVGFVIGAVGVFLVGKNNQERMNAAYVQALATQASLQKEIDVLRGDRKSVV